MTAGRWIGWTLCLFALGCALVVSSSVAFDIFGVFRSPIGRTLTVHHNERTAKLMLNERYVPTDFDALLIGGSSTSNWPMSALDFAHFYNESLYGSNAVEEARLVHEAMRTGHFRYAICVVTPYMFESHILNEDGGVSPRREALGSVNLLREEFYAADRSLRHVPSPFFPDGGQAMPPTKNEADPFLTYTFGYDPIALESYRQLLDDLRRSGTKLIFLETPIYEPLYQKHLAQFTRFYADFPLRHPDEPLIDFDLPQYAAFRAQRDRWVDPPHLNDASGKEIAAELNRAIHRALPGLPTNAISPAK